MILNKEQLVNALYCHLDCEWMEKCNCELYKQGTNVVECIQLLAKTSLAYRELLKNACILLNDHFCGEKHYLSKGELAEVQKILNETKVLLDK